MRRLKIKSYSFGKMVTEQAEYHDDLMIVDSEVHENWFRRHGHRLLPEDLEWILERKPDFLVIGTGSSGRMRVTVEVKDVLAERGIDFQVKPTDTAVKLFNDAQKDKSPGVAGAFHLTC